MISDLEEGLKMWWCKEDNISVLFVRFKKPKYTLVPTACEVV